MVLSAQSELLASSPNLWVSAEAKQNSQKGAWPVRSRTLGGIFVFVLSYHLGVKSWGSRCLLTMKNADPRVVYQLWPLPWFPCHHAAFVTSASPMWDFSVPLEKPNVFLSLSLCLGCSLFLMIFLLPRTGNSFSPFFYDLHSPGL